MQINGWGIPTCSNSALINYVDKFLKGRTKPKAEKHFLLKILRCSTTKEKQT